MPRQLALALLVGLLALVILLAGSWFWWHQAQAAALCNDALTRRRDAMQRGSYTQYTRALFDGDVQRYCGSS